MDTKHLENKRVFWSSKWDKLWLLIIPTVFLIDIFISDNYSTFWFWTILILTAGIDIYILYHMFHPKFAWIDPATAEGKQIQKKAFDLRYNDTGSFQYSSAGFYYCKSGDQHSIQWADIKSILAYKRDLCTTDELNMDIFTKNGDSLHLTEEDPGWFQFILKLKEAFPDIDKAFDVKLVLPAFEFNLTLVYDSQGRTLEEVKKGFDNN